MASLTKVLTSPFWTPMICNGCNREFGLMLEDAGAGESGYYALTCSLTCAQLVEAKREAKSE